jgi:hypothetical protein
MSGTGEAWFAPDLLHRHNKTGRSHGSVLLSWKGLETLEPFGLSRVKPANRVAIGLTGKGQFRRPAGVSERFRSLDSGRIQAVLRIGSEAES